MNFAREWVGPDSYAESALAAATDRLVRIEARMEEEATTAEVIRILRGRGYTITPPETPTDLRCAFCGATLAIETHDVGRPYLPDVVPEAIVCEDYSCGAEWEPDGTLRTAPTPRETPP